MVYTIDDDLEAFENKAWSGGKQTLDMIRNYDNEHNTNLFGQLSAMADEFFTEDDAHTETEVNDWLWFDVPEYDEFQCVFNPTEEDETDEETEE